MKTIFKILEIECQSCAIMIENVAEDYPGVRKAVVKMNNRTLIVEHAQAINPSELAGVLAKAGYKVELLLS